MSAANNPCREFFESNASNPKKVELLINNPDKLEWEKINASQYSPGIISNDEFLIRTIISPIHIDHESGLVKPSCVSDVKDKGGSSDRELHSTPEDSVERINKVQQEKNESITESNKKRAVIGYSKISVNKIRSIHTNDNKRSFGIYDTSLKENISHSDICQLIPEKVSDPKDPNQGQARAARSKLFDIVKETFKKL